MSGVNKLDLVVLTPPEKDLFKQINFDLSAQSDRDIIAPSRSAASKLTRSLLERKAIPEVRIRYFTDPELNIGGRKKSRKDIFEANGTKGNAIFAHPHFLRYLKYFIFGPDLSKEIISGFMKIVVDDSGTSVMILDQLSRFVRAEIRRLAADERQSAADEFFKLALECGLDIGIARSIRDAARTTK